MDLKDVMGMEQAENTRDTAPVPPVQQEAAVIPSVPAQSAVDSTGKKKKHILPWLIGGGVLLLILVIVCIFLLLPKNTGKAQAFAFFKNDKAYLCLQGMEDSPVSLPSKNSDYNDGLLFNANRDKLVILDENGGLYYIPLTAAGGEEGAKRIDRAVEDVCFWNDSIMYVKEGSLYQYTTSTEEKTELFSAVSHIYHFDNENTDGFLVCRTDESAWCFDKNEKDFVKVCDNYYDVLYVLPDGESIYFKKDGDLYFWQAGKEEEFILEDCDDVVQAAEDGSLYFVRSETKSLSLYDFLDDDFLGEDKVSEDSNESLCWKMLKSYSSFIWLNEESLRDFDVDNYEGIWICAQNGSYPTLQVAPIHRGEVNIDEVSYVTLEDDTAVVTRTFDNNGQYKITYTFKNLDSTIYYPQCEVEVKTLKEPEKGEKLSSALPSAGVYYNISESTESESDLRNSFRKELKNASYEYTEKTLFYFDGSDVSKVADSYWMNGANLDPETGVFYYETREMPHIKFSELTADEYTVEAFTEKLEEGEGEAQKDFGFAFKGKVSENLTEEALALKENPYINTVLTNEDGTILYFLEGSDLYMANVGKDKIEKPQKIEESVFSYFIGKDGELYISKAEDKKAVLYIGDEKIAEDISSYSVNPVEEGDGCVFLDTSNTLYVYSDKGLQEIDDNVDGDVYAYSASYIPYIKNYDAKAESGTLYVYTGGEPIKVEVGVKELSLSYFL